MSKSCLHCGKIFKGMARRGVNFAIGPLVIRLADKKFCDDHCESMYAAERAQEVRVWQFLQWLHSRPP